MKNMKRALSFLLMLCMLLTVLPAQILAVEQDAAAPDAGASTGSGEGDDIQNVTVEPLDPSEVTARPQVDRDYDERIFTPQGNVRVIIEMEADPILAIGAHGADAKTQAAYIRNQQEEVIERIEDEVLDGEKLDVRYSFTTLLNGVATQVPADSLNAIRQVEGVAHVTVQQVYEPLAGEVSDDITAAIDGALDREGGIKPDSDDMMVGSDGAWAQGYMGEGLRIAVIDTGIDTDHPSFGEMDTTGWDTYAADRLLDMDDIADVIGSLNAAASYKDANPLQSELTAADVYHSNKIPFAFNYIDVNYNRVGHDYDSQGDHGTHVSGIAAANPLDTTKVVGVAPNAQIMTFKVFGESGGAYTDDIVAALEDAVTLGADVVNMSLGTNGGLRSSGSDIIDRVYASLESAGVILAVAGGNSYTAGLYNNWGDNKSLTTDIDNGIISSPASYPNATSVASVSNSEISAYYVEIGGQKFTYTNGSTADGTASPNADLNTIGGKSYGVAVVGNMGQTAEDFTKAGVSGKIAIVSRGVTAFTEKGKLAQDAGAVALIVYNNEEGSMGMDMSAFEGDIPVVIVTKKIGGMILDIIGKDPDAQMFVSNSTDFVNTYEGGEASDFSSWGPLSSLHLEPDIAAPGGGIFSTRNGGIYGEMSGTSMATPNLAGVAALVKQYLMDEYNLSGTRLFDRVNQLMMSTSQPQVYSTNGLYYSPRQQGSGLARADLAVKTSGYITVNDSAGNPKAEAEVELFDDPDGHFKFAFTVHNTGTVDNYYNVHTRVQTEGVSVNENLPGLYFMSGLPEVLDADVTVTSSGIDGMIYDFDGNGVSDSNDAQWLSDNLETAAKADSSFYDLDGDGDVDGDDVQRYLDLLTEKSAGSVDGWILKVPANGSVIVTVELQVTSAGRSWLSRYYPKGGYVEGFMMLDALSGEEQGCVDLSIPYMGFCGDWTEPNMYEEAMFWDDENDPDAPLTSTDANTVWVMVDGNYTVPGLNPYVSEDVEPFDINNIAISPNNDGNADLIEDIYLYLMRNAEYVSVYFKDENGRILNNKYTSESGNVAYAVPKSNYSASYGIITPFVASWYFDTYQFIDPDNGRVLPDGTKLTLEISAKLPYGTENENIYTWTIPITVDTQAPQVVVDDEHPVTVEKVGNRQLLTVTVTDTVNIAAAFITNSSGTVLRGAPVAFDKTNFKPGEPITVTYDVTGCGNSFCLGLCDYGYNESFYKLTTDGNDPEVDFTKLYGYRVGDSEHLLQTGGYDDHVYGWVAIDPADGTYAVQSDDYWVDYAINAAEYYGGYVVAVLYNGEVVAIRPGYWDERMPVSQISVTNANGYKVTGYKELAFNPEDTGNLYIMLEMVDTSGVTGTYLGKLDVESGEVTLLTDGPSSGGGVGGFPMPGRPGIGGGSSQKPNSTGSTIRVMAFDNDGTLFGITTGGHERNRLVTVDTATGKIDKTVCDFETAVGAHMGDYATSMTWYKDAFYVSFMAQDDAKLVKIALTKEESEEEEVTYKADISIVKDLDADPCFEGLLALDDRGFALDLVSAPESIRMNPARMRLLPGNNANVNVIPTPWYANVKDLVWASGDDSVVTVNTTSGDIRTVAKGTTEVTATMVGEDGEDITATCALTVVDPESNLRAFINSEGSGIYNGQWIGFTANAPQKFEKVTNYSFFELSAAEYVDGFIYAYNNYTRTLYRYDTAKPIEDTGNYPYVAIDWGNSEYGIVADLAYNYSDGNLYGLRLSASQESVDLIRIDMLTGRHGEEDPISGPKPVISDLRLNGSSAAALTIDDDGTCYVVAVNGTFGTVNLNTKAVTVKGMTGYSTTAGAASMTMDRETEDIYLHTWNMGVSEFLWIDKDSGTAQDLGAMLSNAAVIGLYWVPGEDYEEPVAERYDVVTISAKELYLVEGSNAPIRVEVMPINAMTADMIDWSVTEGGDGITVENGVVYADAGTGGKDFTVTGDTGLEGIDSTLTIQVHVLEKPENKLGMFVTQTPNNNGHIWAKFDLADLDAAGPRVNTSDTFIGAVEYYNGNIYAYGYGETGYRAVEFKTYDPELYMVQDTKQVGGNVFPIDMTLDYTTSVMYAIGRNISDQYGAKTLYVVNIETGELLKLADIKDEDGKDVYLVTLACNSEGQLYGIGVDSMLYTIEKDGLAEEVALLKDPFGNSYHILPDEEHRMIIYMQSMTFDPDTDNLYWAYTGNREVQVQGDTLRTFESKLVYIHIGEEGSDLSCTELGILSMTGAEGVGLHIVPVDKEVTNAGLCDMVVDASKIILMQGDTATVHAFPLPFGTDCTVTWTSDNDEVATVKDGVITAVGSGTATVTVEASNGDKEYSKEIEVTVASEDDMFVVTTPNGWSTTPIYATGKNGEASGDTVLIAISHDTETGKWYGIDEKHALWEFENASLTGGDVIVEDVMEDVPRSITKPSFPAPKVEKYFEDDSPIEYIDFEVHDGSLYLMVSGSLIQTFNYQGGTVSAMTLPTYIFELDLAEVEEEDKIDYSMYVKVSSLSTCAEMTFVGDTVYILDTGENTVEYIDGDTDEIVQLVKWDKSQYDQQPDVYSEETGELLKHFGTGMAYSEALKMLYVVGVDNSNYNGIVIFAINLSNGEWQVVNERSANMVIPPDFYDVAIIGVEDKADADAADTSLEDDVLAGTPEDADPAEDAPVEDAPVEDEPVEDAPVEDEPVEDEPVEPAPDEDAADGEADAE